MRGRILAMVLLLAGCGHAGARSTARPLPPDRDPQALLANGQAYAAAGDLVRAEQYLAAALAANGDEHVVLPVLLRVCVASQHYRLAAEYAEVALTRDPKNANLRFLTGSLYVAIGEPGRARENLEQAARDRTGDAEVQFAVGTFFRDDLSDRVAADPYFRAYLRISPSGRHADEARTSLMERLP